MNDEVKTVDKPVDTKPVEVKPVEAKKPEPKPVTSTAAHTFKVNVCHNGKRFLAGQSYDLAADQLKALKPYLVDQK